MRRNSIRPPCEIIVKKLFPALRAALVEELINKHKLTQIQVAEKLGITQPAISQYVNQARGAEYKKILKFFELDAEVKKMAAAIAKNRIQFPNKFQIYCEICTKMKKKINESLLLKEFNNKK